MDALYVLHTARQHQQVCPELQSHWHQLTLGTSPWDYLKTITLALHPVQILFVPQAFSDLQNVTKLEIICKPLYATLIGGVGQLLLTSVMHPHACINCIQ